MPRSRPASPPPRRGVSLEPLADRGITGEDFDAPSVEASSFHYATPQAPFQRTTCDSLGHAW